MLSIRNVSILRATYLFVLNLCGRIVYGREKWVERPAGDALLNKSEVSRIRRINSELVLGPKVWEDHVDSRTASNDNGTHAKFYTFHEVASCLCDAGEALAGDSLTAAFTSVPPDPWNFMLRTAGPSGIPWLFVPLWLLGVWLRYCILLPIRIAILLWGACTFTLLFAMVSLCFPKSSAKNYVRKRLICWFSSIWVASFSGIIRYHGRRPKRIANQVYVSNHTSLLDAYVMVKDYPFSLIGQRHSGIAGSLQDLLMSVQSHVWFDRSEGRDRRVVGTLLKEHVQDGEKEPMLIFPEGTCVNNEYCIMFKKGCFELGATVFPIAIKYNKQFADPFWNSTQVSFGRHLFELMTSWAVVADVYYLEPQELQEGETPAQFAERVKSLICEKADLIAVNWDGFLKRNKISPKFMAQRQRALAEVLVRRVNLSGKSLSADNLSSMVSDNTVDKTPAATGALRSRRSASVAAGVAAFEKSSGEHPTENGVHNK